jgi:hypothetical protein
MPTPLVHGGVAVAALLLSAVHPARAQDPAGERLRKTDLVRLLANPTLATGEVAARIRSTCLTFTPTVRDRADFVALGADSSVLREIAACARRPAKLGVPARRAQAAAASARTSPSTVTPTRRETPALAPRATGAPGARAAGAVAPQRPPPLSGVRTGFVLGVGQHGTVGAHLPFPLLFEVRDTGGAPVPGQAVGVAVANGRLGTTRAVTDSNGRVHVELILGTTAGPVAVSATVGTIVRQATLFAEAGPAARLVLRCGKGGITGRLGLAPGVPAVLRVTAQDGFGNEARVTGLQAAAGDRGVVRVASVDIDSAGGVVRLAPGEEGSTSLVVAASAQREDVSVTVARQPMAGATHCPE